MDTLVHPYDLYAGGMAKRELRSAQEVRDGLSARVDEALKGTHTVITRHARPVAVLVDMDWYRRASELMEDPLGI